MCCLKYQLTRDNVLLHVPSAAANNRLIWNLLAVFTSSDFSQQEAAAVACDPFTNKCPAGQVGCTLKKFYGRNAVQYLGQTGVDTMGKYWGKGRSLIT
jgi:hypothetical protein